MSKTHDCILPGQLLLDDEVLENPNSFYRRLVEEAPVWRAGDSDVYVISSHVTVAESCRRVEDFSSNLVYLLYREEDGLPGRAPHRLGGDAGMQALATADPPDHARHKKLISPEFSPKRMASLESQIFEMSRERLARGLAVGRMELMNELANPIPIDVVTELIGFKERNTQALFNAAILQTDIERPRGHVAFGSGIHVCLGNTLARLEVRVILECLLAFTSSFILDSANRSRWMRSLAVRRLDRLPLIVNPK